MIKVAVAATLSKLLRHLSPGPIPFFGSKAAGRSLSDYVALLLSSIQLEKTVVSLRHGIGECKVLLRREGIFDITLQSSRIVAVASSVSTMLGSFQNILALHVVVVMAI